MSGREVAIAVNENSTNNEHRIVLRRYSLHTVGHLSFPAGPCNEIVARLCACLARADIREVDVKRIGEPIDPRGERRAHITDAIVQEVFEKPRAIERTTARVSSMCARV
jgi:hypothetical protein